MISLFKCQKVSSKRSLEKCINLAAKVFSETSDIDFQELLNEYREWLNLKDNIFIIAKSPSEEIIGFIRIVPKEISLSIGLINTARFENVFIVASHRGKNISKVLINYAIKVSVENNMKIASVIARKGVDHFYPKFGFHGVSCYPKVSFKLSELKKISLKDKEKFSLEEVNHKDLNYISKLYNYNYKKNIGSGFRTLNYWKRIFSYCKKDNIRIYKVHKNASICSYCIFHKNNVLEFFYNDFSSILYLFLEVMNKYDEIIFHQTIDYEFFKSLNNIDLKFGTRSCPYGGHMLAILDIEFITKTFHQKFKDYLIKSNIQNFSTKSANFNLEYKRGNLKIDLPDNISSEELKLSDIELLLGIKNIYSNNLNGFCNYFYFPDLDQRI